MRKRRGGTIKILAAFALILLLAGVVWWQRASQYTPVEAPPSFQTVASQDTDAYITPIPQTLVLDSAKVALGRKLFHDVRLSANNSMSCATCHPLDKGGMDNRAHSIGINGSKEKINTPTVFNSGFNFRQFWDGRAATLEEQIDGPVNNPLEMGSTWQQVIAKINSDREYLETFARIYRDGVTASNIKDAIATFERSLTTPNSRFDRYLRGDEHVLAEVEKRGYRMFIEYGCAGCHQGMNVGGNMYQKMGVMEPYVAGDEKPEGAAQGRFNVTGREEDRGVFRVPSLRLAARTAPYFHDGSVPTLELAVALMARYQLGRSIPQEDVHAIVMFMATLDGGYAGEMK